MIHTKLKLAICLFFITMISLAQGEANIWYFGNHAGLDFNSGNPVALTNGQLNTEEGCATLSNAAGQLLFYTDGTTIYNKNHQVMLNGTGLMGNSSTTQSATIVPKPGSATLFYVFTIDYEAHANGFRYSVIDLTLDGGLGGVTADKNILVYTPTLESIGITKHANGTDYWIVTHGCNSNTFYSHLLTSSGLSSTPVTTNVGAVITGIGFYSAGTIKISPSGSKLALTSVSDIAQLFNFNNSTGVISNGLTLLAEGGELYGVEFSPDESILYISNAWHKLYQFNLSAADIPASKFTLYDDNKYPGTLQLGPDGKIYMAVINQNKIAVINNPDVVGIGCNFQLDAIDLAGKISLSGLPSFNQSFFFNPSIELENACVGQNTQLELNTNQTIVSATWDFGDGSPTSNAIIANHTYTTAGTYTVTVTATSPVGTNTKSRNIVISAMPSATQPQDMLQCDTDNNGLYAFDLTTRNTFILNSQNPNQFTVKYFANAADYSNNVAIATPTGYQNVVAYQQQTIIAEVSNNANTNCKATTTFAIDVFDTPLPNLPVNIPALALCDNTTIGTDTDGRILFNLNQRAATILNGQSPSQFSIVYYTDAALSNLITTPENYSNTNPTETIYAKVVNNDNPSCMAMTSFTIQVLSLPVITSTVTLKQCDDNTDGYSIFNLTEANNTISTNHANETFAYFETLSNAQSNILPIQNFTAYPNQIVSNDVVYVRISNSNNCYRTAQLNLNVSTTQIPLNFTRNFTVCDDSASGTNTDGIAEFDFSSVTNEVQNLFPAGQQLIITYYKNLANALAENNAITDISNYSNIGYPNSQNIYIRVDSQVNNDCLGLGSHITLHVEKIPIVSPQELKHCDDDQDGQFGFDTTNLQSNLLNGLTNVTVSYLDQNNNPLPSPLPNPFVSASQTVKAVVTNNTPTACSYETTISFIVDDLPEVFPLPASLTTACDDETNPVLQDGKYPFNTSTFQSTILNSQAGMTVAYFDGNNNLLPSPLPNPFLSGTQNVRVEVTNPSNTNCKTVATIPFIVNPVPNISLLGDELVCSNNTTFTKTIDAGIQDNTLTSDYTYVWKLNGAVIPNETNYSLTVNQEGIYTVEVFNNLGCSRTRTITVTASDIATITNVEVTDFSSDNSIVVHVTGNGNYVYSLDNSIFQTSNVFLGLEAGIYTVYVKDLNGCGIVKEDVNILGIPSFFTPNGDGYHDFWNIKGINRNSKGIVHIFDRLGKLIKQISTNSQGWDGTFNNQPLPATDYWYIIKLADGREFKGHFALKR
ncbi:T9SS type B sorting domain-containing protein [Flavobacterium humi]|uniref:T9SS type B sorting domain-containing protein n=1 Tax=Flavobacterium humi TaxID=2562683 RepID=A0A4Z0LBW6_9FLAO|nr:T9SS type B sorting domain-containing protein [Flavobacterium humi]TGD59382.1 T9SS type B sorting domain-containing protein [Flavobacterium humi]